MIITTKIGKVCTVNHKWQKTFHLEECMACRRYNLCVKFISDLRKKRNYKQILVGYPENHKALLSDKDIETAVKAYHSNLYIDEVAEDLKRTVGSINWIYDIIEKLETDSSADEDSIKAFYGAKRVGQVINITNKLNVLK